MTQVAVIGTGRMGAAHAAAWASLAPDVEVVAVVDRSPGRALAAVPAARVTTDLEGVLADPAVEIVSICTPTDTHLALGARALAAGKHVLLEKPLARTAAEGEALVRLAGRGPGSLMVAQVVRFFPGYVALRRLVDDGTLGGVVEATACRLSATGGRPAWVEDDARSGGVLVELAVHDFDQLLLFLGPATRVLAVPGPDCTVDVTVEHAGGGLGRLRAGWDLPVDFPFTTRLELVGTAGLARYVGEAGIRSELEVEAAGAVTRSRVEAADPYAAQARSFLDHVRRGTPVREGSPADSLAALRLALAARRSFGEGAPVDVPSPDERISGAPPG